MRAWREKSIADCHEKGKSPRRKAKASCEALVKSEEQSIIPFPPDMAFNFDTSSFLSAFPEFNLSWDWANSNLAEPTWETRFANANVSVWHAWHLQLIHLQLQKIAKPSQAKLRIRSFQSRTCVFVVCGVSCRNICFACKNANSQLWRNWMVQNLSPVNSSWNAGNWIESYYPNFTFTIPASSIRLRSNSNILNYWIRFATTEAHIPLSV